ncbi:MAG TPA: ABC transporter permease, partial [Bryobacteraceae bacterium]|nr:ABC transporter permease [Bryobacteraceae bacterium]
MTSPVHDNGPEMSVTVRADREGRQGYLVPSGSFDLAHGMSVARVMKDAGSRLQGCQSVEVDLSHVDRLDGAGAVLLARLLDRLDTDGLRPHILEDRNMEAARLIALYRGRGADRLAPARRMNVLERIGAGAAELPGTVRSAFDFIGHCTIALLESIRHPSSIDWRSLPRLLQEIGANALLVTSSANLLVGLIIGFLGVSQLERFGSVVYVPELVVVAQFRELGPLVTAIVVAGRSGAGLASELATMKVSEE